MTGALSTHLAEGASDVARCWRVTRRDGMVLGFTDHDMSIAFEGTEFKANTGMTAAALSQSTGLAVDNTEALGALSDGAIREEDLAAGRFDGASVEAWLVCWSNPNARDLVFRGTLGEISWSGGAFTAELRGLAEALNQPTGRVYHKSCPCILGDAKCGVDLDAVGFTVEVVIGQVSDARIFTFKDLTNFDGRWFEKGVLEVLDGPGAGLSGVIKNDRLDGLLRQIEIWSPLAASPAEGDRVRVTAGCDKTLNACRLKFNNIRNFRGFPDIPNDDWLMVHPTRTWVLDGGSRR